MSWRMRSVRGGGLQHEAPVEVGGQGVDAALAILHDGEPAQELLGVELGGRRVDLGQRLGRGGRRIAALAALAHLDPELGGDGHELAGDELVQLAPLLVLGGGWAGRRSRGTRGRCSAGAATRGHR